MTALAHHIRIRLEDDQVIAPTPFQRRTLVRTVLSQSQPYTLLVFGLADTHLHLEAAASHDACAQRARRIEITLHYRLQLQSSFLPAHIEPIRDGRHLYNTFYYILDQLRHHDLQGDTLHEGSNLWDLLGLRLIGRYTVGNVRRLLPRVKRERLLGYLEVSRLEPVDDPVELVMEATLAATALADLSGSSREAIEARRGMVQVIGKRITPARLAAMWGISLRSVFSLRAHPADPSLVQAVRLQLGLMADLGVGDALAPFLENPDSRSV